MTNKDPSREAFEHNQRVAATHTLDDALQRQGVYLTWPTITKLVDIVNASRSDPAAPVELPEPFALYDGEKWYANEEAGICSCANMQKLQKIYTEQQVRELLAAAPKLPQGDGWLPIESAPKDGSLIVVHGNNFNDRALGQHYCIAAWHSGCWMESSEWSAPSELAYLTHWMPLPQPPKEVKK